MECSSPRDRDGLAESSRICFPHYTFSRLNGSVSFIPAFCDAVPVGFAFPCFFTPFWRAMGVPWSSSLFCTAMYLSQTLSFPFPHPTLSSSWRPRFHLGFRNVSMQHPYLGRSQVLTSYRVLLPCTEDSCAALMDCSLQWGAVLSMLSMAPTLQIQQELGTTQNSTCLSSLIEIGQLVQKFLKGNWQTEWLLRKSGWKH